jgi:hypothetical protein
MERLEYEPKPTRPPIWPWILIVLYGIGVLACILLGGKSTIPAIEGLTCLFVVPLMLIFGVQLGTQDKDNWT